MQCLARDPRQAPERFLAPISSICTTAFQTAFVDSSSIAELSALPSLGSGQGSFPPPALPGLNGSTNPSAICVRRRWPSRVRRWHGIVVPPPRSQTSLVAHHSCSVRAAIITPVESSAAYLARFTDDSDLPRYSGGSAPTLALSRPSQCSLTLRPARSADPLRGLSIEVLQIIRRLLIRSDRFRLEREFAGPDFHRGERCALPRHTEQSGREFASADPTAGAQDATLQERGLCAKIPLHPRCRLQHFQRPTPSHVSSNTPRAPRRGDDHVAKSRRGGLRIRKA
jgi:hypothetical protein